MSTLGRNWDSPGNVLLRTQLCAWGPTDPAGAVLAVPGSTELLRGAQGLTLCCASQHITQLGGSWAGSVSCLLHAGLDKGSLSGVQLPLCPYVLNHHSDCPGCSASSAVSSPLSWLSTSSPVKFISLVLLTVSLLPWVACKCCVYCLR